jgi:hypothetical protein
MSKVLVAATMIACTLCACAGTPQDAPEEQASGATYKPTGSHIVERRESGRRSPKNSSSAPVQDLKDSPAVTVIQNQPPK